MQFSDIIDILPIVPVMSFKGEIQDDALHTDFMYLVSFNFFPLTFMLFTDLKSKDQ
jgi:hypothetical protein